MVDTPNIVNFAIFCWMKGGIFKSCLRISDTTFEGLGETFTDDSAADMRSESFTCDNGGKSRPS